jgi:hypothetical protein
MRSESRIRLDGEKASPARQPEPEKLFLATWNVIKAYVHDTADASGSLGKAQVA